MSVFTDHFRKGTHAARPAANAAGLPIGAKYSCSDHNLVYETDGTTWSTWFDPSSAATILTTKGDLIARSSSAAARLAVGANGTSLVADSTQTLGVKYENRVKAVVAGTNVTIDSTDPLNPIISSSGGGGGGGWDHPVNALPLTTLTGWTAGVGTWTASGSGIRNADTGAAGHRLRYTGSRFPQGALVAEVDIKIDALTTGTNSRAGFLLNYPFGSDTTNSLLVCLRGNAGNTAIASVYMEYEGVTAGPDFPLGSTIAIGATTTFRVYKVGGVVTVWINGTCICTGNILQGNLDASTFAFYSWGTDVTFSNLDVWTPTLP